MGENVGVQDWGRFRSVSAYLIDCWPGGATAHHSGLQGPVACCSDPLASEPSVLVTPPRGIGSRGVVGVMSAAA